MPISLSGELLYFNKRLQEFDVIGHVESIPASLFGIKANSNCNNINTEVVLKVYSIYAMKKDYIDKKCLFPSTYKEYKATFKRQQITKDPVLKNRFNLLRGEKLQQLQELDRIKVKNYQYTEKSIKQNKSCFLLDLYAELYEKKIVLKKEKLVPLPIHNITADLSFENNSNEKRSVGETHGNISKYINALWEKISREEDTILMSFENFNSVVWKPYQLGSNYINPQPLKKADTKEIAILNQINTEYKNPPNPLIAFAYSFFHSYIDSLQEKHVLSMCPVCHKIFTFRNRRIYCSAKCRKRNQNINHYRDNRETILPRVRKYMKEYHKL